MTPDIAIQDYIIGRLKAVPALADAASAVRRASDQADPRKGDIAIVVSTRDMGGHNGLPGRILVDVDAEVQLQTALSEDTALGSFQAAKTAIMESLHGIADDTALTGLTIRHVMPWTGGGIQQGDTFRYETFSAQFFLQLS